MSLDPIGNSQSSWNWSFRWYQALGIEVRIHWSLLMMAFICALSAWSDGLAWYWMPVLLAIPFASVLLHEYGHGLTTRLLGGRIDTIVMWALGGLAICHFDQPRWSQVFVSALAGPLVSFIIAAICLLSINQGFSAGPREGHVLGWWQALVAYTGSINLSLVLFNLLPAHPLDGGQMLRSLLWPLLGRCRAVQASLWLAYPILGGVLVFGILYHNPFLAALGAILIILAVIEHRFVRANLTAFQEYGEPRPVWERWKQMQKIKTRLRQAEAAANEAAELDRLLEKVKEHGLPALTEAERSFLDQYSKRHAH